MKMAASAKKEPEPGGKTSNVSTVEVVAVIIRSVLC